MDSNHNHTDHPHPHPSFQLHAPITGLASSLKHHVSLLHRQDQRPLLFSLGLPSHPLLPPLSPLPHLPTQRPQPRPKPPRHHHPPLSPSKGFPDLRPEVRLRLPGNVVLALSRSGSGASAGTGMQASPKWDVGKICRVLEGKTAVCVVDIDADRPKLSTRIAAPAPVLTRERECSLSASLEESMRALTLGREKAVGRWASHAPSALPLRSSRFHSQFRWIIHPLLFVIAVP
ncbi:hypothetical protein OF83DRAFT_123016 [Amylostereum chailletii]|nr:hypothetical protein OF83DRAFT_123016 [Amylostereum chailletii]